MAKRTKPRSAAAETKPIVSHGQHQEANSYAEQTTGTIPDEQPGNVIDATNTPINTSGAGAGNDEGQVSAVADGADDGGCTHTRETRGQAWERLRREARTAGMTRRESVAYAGRAVDLLFPPDGSPRIEPPPLDLAPGSIPAAIPATPEPAPAADGQVQGLGAIPEHWPPLPPNASLTAEVAWVQASRLDVVELLPGGGARVRLDRAATPAPSRAALSWLETAILFPAKFADVTLRATQHAEDEREHTRRERADIEGARGLLAEMAST